MVGNLVGGEWGKIVERGSVAGNLKWEGMPVVLVV